MDSAARKRKFSSEESKASTSSILIVSKPRRLEDSSNSTVSDRLSSSSCCLSNDGDELASSKYVHLDEGENENEVSVDFTGTSPGDWSNCSDDRRETRGKVEGELESSLQRVQKMPSEAELEEFFAAAEEAIQMKFIDKYNFDIVKDEPLKGRYEWVQLQLKP